MQLPLQGALKVYLNKQPLCKAWQCYCSFVSHLVNTANGRKSAPLWFCCTLEWQWWSTCMMCLVPCMRKTCKGKVQSACCLMNVSPFLSFLVMCFQKTTMWKVGAFYLIFQLLFAFYFSVFIEYISNIDGKLTFLIIPWFLVVYHFAYGTHLHLPPHEFLG